MKTNITVTPPETKDISKMIENHKKEIKRKTLNISELAKVLGISKDKARRLTHSKDFPVIILGVSRLTIISKLDEWLENNIGSELI
ncbi:helix-turn-helix domain-containing protein [Senegalia massiliensis]|uniref:DNA-binding protein n=1 Tax=Senegalia massiliensis TaxID=1720316 RepID=A0A845QXB3_9CLOT|nr:helix-turn-helix domain-containing protein [Senegalia massiliensis]NBI05792.1 DNA-binding protein [Senegalia massiliensis]